MGQLGLNDLRSVGDAAARLARTFSSPGWLELIADLEAPMRSLMASRGDTHSVTLPAAFALGWGCWSERGDDWHHKLWTLEEAEELRRGAGWCFDLGRRPGYGDQPASLEDVLQPAGVGPLGYFLELSLQLESDDPGAPYLTIRVNTGDRPDTFHQLLRQRLTGTLQETRRVLQSMDALTRGYEVAIDLGWAPSLVCDSTMAQVAEWLVRVEGSQYSDAPTLTEDAYQWWCGWAQRVARRHDDTVTPTDVFFVAKRSIRPASAAGHHRYWKKSLAAHPADDIVQRVVSMLGISRRTVFNRLRAGEKTVAEFYGEPDAARALYDWLKNRPSKTNRISGERRGIVDTLVAAGISFETARKLERRIRALPPEEQYKRLQAAIDRRHHGSRPRTGRVDDCPSRYA